jgi:hypothetical protein
MANNYKKLLREQCGGYKKNALISNIILKLSCNKKQTAIIKRSINNKITKTGHGSIFMGSSSTMAGSDANIRILVGIHSNKNEIGIFGGKSEDDEKVIHTMIRETIEEIFNFKPTLEMVTMIEQFLNENTDCYYIQKMGNPDAYAYSYIFDISILGDFINIMKYYSNNKLEIKIPDPSGKQLYLVNYISKEKFSDKSSVHGILDGKLDRTSELTINLTKFMIDRQIYTHRMPHSHSLNEIKYLSFPSLFKLIDSLSKEGSYNVYNQSTNRRERVSFERILIKILNSQLIDDINHILVNIDKEEAYEGANKGSYCTLS